MNYPNVYASDSNSRKIQTLADIKDHFAFIQFLKRGIQYQGTYHATASKTTQTERPGQPPAGFMLLATLETIGNMQYSRAFAYSFAQNINEPENVNQITLGFTGKGLGVSEPVVFHDACFATIFTINPVGQGGRLWIKAKATASSTANELNVIIR